MAFLDFMQKRTATQQSPVARTSQEQTPEAPAPQTARQMYAQQSAQEKTPPLNQMPQDQQARLEAIKTTLQKATQHIDKNAAAPSPAPADSTDSQEAMRQKMTGQDKAAPALSPTSAEAGQRAAELNSPSNVTPMKTPEKQVTRAPQTVPRRPPSWER
jgi:hypothetical protein